MGTQMTPKEPEPPVPVHVTRPSAVGTDKRSIRYQEYLANPSIEDLPQTIQSIIAAQHPVSPARAEKPLDVPIEPSPEPRKSQTQPTSQKDQLLKSEPIEAVQPIEED
jgi:hypothetical protein